MMQTDRRAAKNWRSSEKGQSLGNYHKAPRQAVPEKEEIIPFLPKKKKAARKKERTPEGLKKTSVLPCVPSTISGLPCWGQEDGGGRESRSPSSHSGLMKKEKGASPKPPPSNTAGGGKAALRRRGDEPCHELSRWDEET